MMKKSVLINYIYFGILFIILSAVHCTHAQVIEQGSGSLKVAFIFYALSQSLLEVSFLALIGAWVGKLARGYQWAFVGTTLILLLMHLIDFPLVRFMDLSIWQALGLVLGETFENFIEMLYATHMSMATWIGGAIALACIFFWAGSLPPLRKKATQSPTERFCPAFCHASALHVHVRASIYLELF